MIRTEWVGSNSDKNIASTIKYVHLKIAHTVTSCLTYTHQTQRRVSTEPIWHVKSMLTSYSLNFVALFKWWNSLAIENSWQTCNFLFLWGIISVWVLLRVKLTLPHVPHGAWNGSGSYHLVCFPSILPPCNPKPKAYWCCFSAVIFCFQI